MSNLTNLTNTNVKKKKKWQPADNPVEAVKDLAASVASDAASIPSDLAENAFQQIFGQPQQTPQEIKPQEEIDLQRIEKERILSYQKQRESVEKNVFSYKEQVMVKKEIEELLRQIKLLINSTQTLVSETKVLAMEEMPVNPGTYHVNFFEWLIRIIKSLRERVEESRSWLSVFTSKKKQKQYWSMFKKHGTSFALSGERVIATQVG